MGHRCNGILVSHKKNKEMPSAATWTHPDIITLSEAKPERKTYTTQYHLCGIQHTTRMNLSVKQKDAQKQNWRSKVNGDEGLGWLA